MSRRALIPVLTAGLLVAPAGAQASKVVISATAGPAAEEFLYFKAYKGERNRVRVQIGKKTITIVDRGVRRLVAGRESGFPPCRQSGRQRVVCPFDGMIFLLGDKNDSLSFAPGKAGSDEPIGDPLRLAEDFSDTEGALDSFTYVDAGSGNDRVSGSDSSDMIVPGAGRDKVQGRAGEDDFFLTPDGAKDSIRGDGDIDALDFSASEAPVTADLAAGTVSGAGDSDRVSGIQRVDGSGGADVLLGGPGADALYGGGGVDTIDGRGGNDLLTGESPDIAAKSANRIAGGEGDDVVDARNDGSSPTSQVDCGPGSDREAGEVDDLVRGCELAAFRLPPESEVELPLYDVGTKIAPVGLTSTTATYEVPCPPTDTLKSSGCTGTLKLERPPGVGAQDLGTGSFSLLPGQRANVVVSLTPAGQAAIATGDAIAVHVTGTVMPTGGASPATIDFGWQQQPLGGS